MQEVLLINPRERGKSRTAAQKAATRRMVAANRARKSGKRKTTITVSANPSPRRRRTNPIVHHVRRRRRNPIAGKPMSILHPALIGALGATTVNTVVGQLAGLNVLPASLATGTGLMATRALAAIGLALVGGKLGMRGSTVQQMAEGSLTVTLHDAITSLAAGAGLTQLQGMRGLRMYPSRAPAAPRGLGMHVSGRMGEMMLAPQKQKMSGFGF